MASHGIAYKPIGNVDYDSPYDLDVDKQETTLDRLHDHYDNPDSQALYEKAKTEYREKRYYNSDDLFMDLTIAEPTNPRAFYYLTQLAQITYFSRSVDRLARASEFGKRYAELWDNNLKKRRDYMDYEFTVYKSGELGYLIHDEGTVHAPNMTKAQTECEKLLPDWITDREWLEGPVDDYWLIQRENPPAMARISTEKEE